MAEFGARHLLSLCVIARDEAINLPRLLGSTAPWVGETIVVDTGSQDETASVATAYGALVFHEPWRHSFAEARNTSLNLATRPWALVLDADEELLVTHAEAFAQALTSQVQAYAIDCHDRLDGGGVAVAPLLRLFRRDAAEMRFVGAVHEQLLPVAQGRVGVARADFLHFRHDGHTATVVADRRKDERNLSLAQRQVQEQPEDPFAWFCLGQALLTTPSQSRQQQAEQAFSQALTRLEARHEGEAFVVSLFANQAATQAGSGRAEAALATLTAALRWFPASADLRLARAQLLMREAGGLPIAEADLRVCLSEEAARFFVRLDPHAVGYKARTQLAIALIKQGRIAEALPVLQQAADDSPGNDQLAPTLLAKVLSASKS